MFLFLTALITCFALLIFSATVFDLLPKFISNNKSVFNIVAIIITSSIFVPAMLGMYNLDSLYHPIKETNRWENLDNLGNFIFLWGSVILFTYIFYNVLVYISKISKINLNEEQKNESFLYKIYILLMMLCIVVSIFWSMDFLSKNPIVRQQQECTKFEPAIGKGLGREVKYPCTRPSVRG